MQSRIVTERSTGDQALTREVSKGGRHTGKVSTMLPLGVGLTPPCPTPGQPPEKPLVSNYSSCHHSLFLEWSSSILLSLRYHHGQEALPDSLSQTSLLSRALGPRSVAAWVSPMRLKYPQGWHLCLTCSLLCFQV